MVTGPPYLDLVQGRITRTRGWYGGLPISAPAPPPGRVCFSGNKIGGNGLLDGSHGTVG